jgi:Tol biopolymer transport system component
MPDVQEVFRMSTQKVRQDPGAMERQLSRQRRAARNRKAGAFAVVGAILALVIVAAVVMSDRGSKPAPSVAGEPGGTGQSLSIVDVGSGTETVYTAPHGASDFDVTLDGSMVAYIDLDGNGNAQVFVMDADGSNARQLTHGVGGVRGYGPSWSPDGSMIAYERDTSDNSQIFIVRLSNGVSTKVTREPRGAVDPGGWAPDGGSIVYSTINVAGTRYTARSLDLTTGQSRLLVPDASTPMLSPDGARIAFTSWLKPQGRLIFANSDGSERRVIARSLGDDGYQRWSPDSTQIAYVDSTADSGLGTYVYDLATGEARFVTAGTIESWTDDGHILVSGR